MEATEFAPAIARRQAFMLGIVSPIDIGAYYAAADVLVLPSMCQESFGLVVLEAFSAGLPAIAFRSGGVPELIDHPRNGLLVHQGDEAALLSSMREMMLARDAASAWEPKRERRRRDSPGTAQSTGSTRSIGQFLPERRFPSGRRPDRCGGPGLAAGPLVGARRL
jgi:glycogen synthase